jgi:hypothetical protein
MDYARITKNRRKAQLAFTVMGLAFLLASCVAAVYAVYGLYTGNETLVDRCARPLLPALFGAGYMGVMVLKTRDQVERWERRAKGGELVMVPTIVYWAIRHNPTGYLIPMAQGRDGRGGSHMEPAPASVDTGLFRSERAAKGFLTTWLKGKVVADRGMDSGAPECDPEYYEKLRTIQIRSRKREEMEIVKATLTF